MIGTLFKFATSLVKPVAGLIGQRQSNRHDYAVARLQDTQSSWKDEFVVVSFVGIFPAAFIGYLLDPILVWLGVGPWFGPAIEQYLGFMNRIVGAENTQHIIIACIGLAGANIVQKGVDRRSMMRNRSTPNRTVHSRPTPAHWK